MKQALTVNMHVADMKRARSAADRLGMGFEEYVLLCAHLIGSAVLEGRKTIEVPAGSANTENWNESGLKCVRRIYEQVAA
ncbi:hypothetical protein [Cupriavidus necator]|uniref:hypothetical protein n=1 Tax=Cupriavidus necator TaxID=106590 RepID=UPI0005B4048F|nr:hypothetical protein [Cupriavidus necator]